MNWRSMETAPRDMTDIAVRITFEGEDTVIRGSSDSESTDWIDFHNFKIYYDKYATGWMPLDEYNCDGRCA